MYAKGFQGTIPPQSLSQMMRLVDFSSLSDVYVACSGTFRVERALLAKFPSLRVHSNDVSIMSCAAAGLAVGKPETFAFKGALEFVEELGLDAPLERAAALMVAMEYGAFATGSTNRYKTAHAEHYRANFRDLVLQTAERLGKTVEEMPIASFSKIDWTDHVEAAIEAKACIVAFPPTYKGGYEKQYAWLNENTEWEPPGYKVFDPKDLAGIIDRIDASGISWCVVCDQEIEGRQPAAEFVSGRAKPVITFAGGKVTSFEQRGPTGQPFAYKALDVGALTEKSRIDVVPCDGAKVTFLKNVFLKKTILHAPGMWNALVYLDGMLAGAMSFSLSKYGAKNEVYLMSDFSTTRAGRVAKLIARVATNRVLIREMERRWLDRYAQVMTTAFSDHPVSMKYRGSWDVAKRSEVNAPEGKFLINYTSPVRDESLEATFAWWWKRDGSKAVEAYRNRDAEGGPAVAEAA